MEERKKKYSKRERGNERKKKEKKKKKKDEAEEAASLHLLQAYKESIRSFLPLKPTGIKPLRARRKSEIPANIWVWENILFPLVFMRSQTRLNLPPFGCHSPPVDGEGEDYEDCGGERR